MPSKGIGIKVHTAQGQVKLYFTRVGSAPALQRELQCHRIDVNAGRVVTRQGEQYVTAQAPELAVREYDDFAYGQVGDAEKRAVVDSVSVVADRLHALIGITAARPGGRRDVIVNCHAGRHRSPACVVAYIRRYGVKLDGSGYTVAEARAIVDAAFAHKAAKLQAKREPHAATPQPYFARTVGDFPRFGL